MPILRRAQPDAAGDESHRGRTLMEIILLIGIIGGGISSLAHDDPSRYVGLALVFGALLALARLVTRDRCALFSLEADRDRLRQDKHEFVATVSHELRTPLTAVVGFSQLLSDEARPIEPQRRRDYLRILQEQAQHLARIVEDTVDLSRIEDGRLYTRPVTLDLRRALEGALTLLGPTADGERLDIVVAPDTPSVWADQGELEQVLDRVLHVALTQAARRSRVLVQVAPGPGGGARVAVSTKGLDLDSDTFAALAENAEAPALWRNGERYMSMAAARAIVELHGGRIWTEQRGEDTTICFDLPSGETQLAGSPARRDQSCLPAGVHPSA